MPVVTLPLDPEGPVITLLVGVSHPRQGMLQAANLPVPQPVQIRALIDTGASGTLIVAASLQSLALVPSGTTSMITPSTGPNPVPVDQYDVSLILTHPPVTIAIPAWPIVECQSLGGNYQALLGRDFLSLCLFVYDGRAQRFSLGY
jgi:hypothetical protein